VTSVVTLSIDTPLMQPGIAEILGPRPTESRIVRVLWRMQGPSRVIVARIDRHPLGRELIVAFEGGADEDLLETRFERFDYATLERRGEQLRELLESKGWAALVVGGA